MNWIIENWKPLITSILVIAFLMYELYLYTKLLDDGPDLTEFDEQEWLDNDLTKKN